MRHPGVEEPFAQADDHGRQHPAAELLDQITNTFPARFERLAVELLVKMGYGGGIIRRQHER